MQDQTRNEKTKINETRLSAHRLVVQGKGARGHDLLHVLAVPELHEGVPAAILPLTQVNPTHDDSKTQNERNNERDHAR